VRHYQQLATPTNLCPQLAPLAQRRAYCLEKEILLMGFWYLRIHFIEYIKKFERM